MREMGSQLLVENILAYLHEFVGGVYAECYVVIVEKCALSKTFILFILIDQFSSIYFFML